MIRWTRVPALWLLAASVLAPLAGCGGEESSSEFQTKMVYYAMPG